MPHILLVTNDHALARLLERIGRESGYEITLASTGKRGLELASSEGFDLVAIDAQLPVLDGFTLACVFREERLYLDLPLIGLTCYADEVERLLLAGVDHVVLRPVGKDHMAEAIDVAFAQEARRRATATMSALRAHRRTAISQVAFLRSSP